jgi:hypothetical protein
VLLALSCLTSPVNTSHSLTPNHASPCLTPPPIESPLLALPCFGQPSPAHTSPFITQNKNKTTHKFDVELLCKVSPLLRHSSTFKFSSAFIWFYFQNRFNWNGTEGIRHLCKIITVFGCHRCLIISGADKRTVI